MTQKQRQDSNPGPLKWDVNVQAPPGLGLLFHKLSITYVSDMRTFGFCCLLLLTKYTVANSGRLSVAQLHQPQVTHSVCNPFQHLISQRQIDRYYSHLALRDCSVAKHAARCACGVALHLLRGGVWSSGFLVSDIQTPLSSTVHVPSTSLVPLLKDSPVWMLRTQTDCQGLKQTWTVSS